MSPLSSRKTSAASAASALRASAARPPAPARVHRTLPLPRTAAPPPGLPAAATARAHPSRSASGSPPQAPTPALQPAWRSLAQCAVPGGQEVTLQIGGDMWRLRVTAALTAGELHSLAARLEKLVALAEQAARRRGMVAHVITLGRGEVRVAGVDPAAVIVTGSSWPSPLAEEQAALAHLREVEQLLRGRAALRLARGIVPGPSPRPRPLGGG